MAVPLMGEGGIKAGHMGNGNLGNQLVCGLTGKQETLEGREECLGEDACHGSTRV